MPPLAPPSHVLPAKALAALGKGRMGKLTPQLTAATVAPVTLWDTFDQELRRSGRQLWETAGRLTLLQSDGTVLTQASDRTGNFVTDLLPGPVKTALADLSPLRCLLLLGQGQITESRLALVDDQHKTCARAELRLFTPGRGALLVTVQGLRGYDKAAEALRGQLARLGARPVAELAEALLPGPPYRAKPDVEIGPDDTAFDATTRIIAAYLPILRANEPGILADHDSEFLHDYRIGLRKIRLILSLFDGVYRTEALRDRFAALMQATGPLRDLDVALLDRARAFALLPPALHPGVQLLFATLAAERRAAHATLARHLDSPAYRDEIKALTRLFSKPRHLRPGKLADLAARDLALRLIRARHQKICRASARITADTPDSDLHLIRLDFKKLRYLMEFFTPLFPALPFKTIRKAIKGLQDLLGQFNDGSVQQLRLQEVLSRQASAPMAMAQSVGALMATLHAAQAADRAAALAALEAFTGPEMCATFHTMVLGQEVPS